MIAGYGDRRTEEFANGAFVREFQGFAQQAHRRLEILDGATSLGDLQSLGSNRLKSLEGRRRGQYSIWINRQWRICFVWSDQGPSEVEIVDYH